MESFNPGLSLITEVDSKYEDDERAVSLFTDTQDSTNQSAKHLEYSKAEYRNMSD
jgi:hypothetical protein